MPEQTDCAQSKPKTATQLKRLRNGLPDGCPIHSPWGAIQHGEKLADGVFFISTAGHGGINLDRARNALIPDAFRGKSDTHRLALLLTAHADPRGHPPMDTKMPLKQG